MALYTLLNARSAKVKGLQLMVSLMLVARATGRQVNIQVYTHVHALCIPYMHVVYVHVCVLLQAMTLLNHAGVCMNYIATWDHLLALTQQANLLSKIQGGH